MRSLKLSPGYWIANATWIAINPSSSLPSTHPLTLAVKALMGEANAELSAIIAADQYLQKLFLWHTVNLKKQSEMEENIKILEDKLQAVVDSSFPTFQEKDPEALSWFTVYTSLKEMDERCQKAIKRTDNYEADEINEEVMDLINRNYGRPEYNETGIKKWRDNSIAKKNDFNFIFERRRKLYMEVERLQRKTQEIKTLIPKLEEKMLKSWEKNGHLYVNKERADKVKQEIVEAVNQKALLDSIVKANNIECMEARRSIFSTISSYHEKHQETIVESAQMIQDWYHRNSSLEHLLEPTAFFSSEDIENNTARKSLLQKIGWGFINQTEMLELKSILKYPFWIAMAYGNSDELPNIHISQMKMNTPLFKEEPINPENNIGIA